MKAFLFFLLKKDNYWLWTWYFSLHLIQSDALRSHPNQRGFHLKRPGIIWSTGIVLLFFYGACHGKEFIQVGVKNHCRQPIKIAYHFKSLDGRSITQGWLILRPGQKRLTNIKTEKRVIYFYAKNRFKIWSGNNRPYSVKLPVSSRHFKYHDKGSASTVYRQKVNFFRYKVDKRTRLLVGHFRCRKKLKSSKYPASAAITIRPRQTR